LGKKHPYQKDDDCYHNLFAGIGAWVTEGNIFDFINYSDGVISINSSSAVEAALLGKPILLLGQSILEKNEAVLKLGARDDLSKALETLIDKMQRQQECFDERYWERLLFGYLYSADKVNSAIGIKTVGAIKCRGTIASDRYDSPEFDELIGTFFTRTFHKLMEYNSLCRQAAGFKAENDDLKEQVQGIVHSLSWRLTRPLRYIREKMGL
jgi:hypothetical protein